MHLDTVCTMVDVDAVTMYPPVADTLLAYPVTSVDGMDELAVGEPGAVPGGRPRGRSAWTGCG